MVRVKLGDPIQVVMFHDFPFKTLEPKKGALKNKQTTPFSSSPRKHGANRDLGSPPQPHGGDDGFDRILNLRLEILPVPNSMNWGSALKTAKYGDPNLCLKCGVGSTLKTCKVQHSQVLIKKKDK